MPAPANETPASDESESLSDGDISLLCDIGDSFPDKLDGEKRARLERLLARGFVEHAPADKAPAKYQLTAKATKILTERGVGLNEA
jgi:hypothetical protein